MRNPLCIVIAAVLALGWAGCATAPPPSTSEVLVIPGDRLPEGPGDAAWDRVPVHTAELLLQDMVEPRLLEPSTPRIDVQAVSDGQHIAFRLRWTDATLDDLPGAARFTDACAVQLPQVVAADVPAPQMGETDRAVEITYWRASWQATVDGRADDITALYPGASIDHYPFEAASLEPGSEEQRKLALQYAPARELGHAMEGPRSNPVQDLLAQGPGTLTPVPETTSEGRGRRVQDGWEVMIVRRLPAGLEAGHRSQVAFAVWDGHHDEVGARKMRSGWIPLHVREVAS